MKGANKKMSKTNVVLKEERNCDITPDISVMKKMASISGTIPHRLMELVDNAIDARIEGKKLEVTVNIVKRGEKYYIEIADNGCGMNELQAKKYFRLGDSDKANGKNIGKFGLGAKVAILGLGNACRILTYPIHENYKISMMFDINKFTDWNIKYNVQEKEQKELHGTYIRIDHLSVRIGSIDRFCERLQEHFAKVYKHFIEKGLVSIKVNKKEVEPQPTELISNLYQTFDFKISNGKRVYGWAGAMKQAGVNWKFGFDLIHNGRIIKANDLLSRQAHTSLARLTGEIHLDDFETDVHKTDFLRDKDDFQEMQTKLLENEINEIVTKIARLTNREVFTKHQDDMQQISKILNKVMRSEDFLAKIDIDQGIFRKMKENAKKRKERRLNNPTKDEVDEVLEEIDELLELDIELELDELILEGNEDVNEMEENKKKKKQQKPREISGLVIREPIGVSVGEFQPSRRWVASHVNGGYELVIEVNLDHPTYLTDNDQNVGIQMKNAVIDSIAEFILNEEKNYGSYIENEIERVNEIKDIIIRQSVAM